MSLSLFNPILFFIFSLPLFFYLYNIRSPFELPKLTYSIVYVLILLVFHCLEQVKKKQLQIKYNNYFKLYTFFILANIVSYFFSTNPYISFWGDSHLPADSLISTLIFYIFSFLILQYADDETKINKIMKVFIITAFIQVIYGVVQRLKLDPMPWAEAQTVFGTQGLTVSYACLIGCLNPFVISQIYRSKKHVESFFLFFLIAVINYILLCTGSRTPIVVNWASSLFISLFYLYHHKKFKPGFKFCVLLLTTGLTVFSFKLINSNSEIEQKAHSFLLNKGFETRKVLFMSGLEAWKKRPIVGYGPETYMFAQKPYQSIELNQFESWNSIWVKAHNSFIHFLVSIGLLGFLSFLSLYFYTAYKSCKIFFTKEPTEHQAIAFTIFTGYQFLFFANLTGFNLIATQMLYAIFPVLFSLYDGTGGQLK
ncbi:MAG: O-antigen ligase family protein, partial [Pseudobdellovibrio sp.]